MASFVKTEVTHLPESRVKVQVQVDPSEVALRVQSTAQTLGRDMRVPGFRKGKVPAQMVIRKLGWAAVLEQTVRNSLGAWYSAALREADIEPIGEPKLEVGVLAEEHEPFEFFAELAVRPVAKLGQYEGLEVAKRESAVDDAAIDQQLEVLRERVGRLEDVDRPAASGDFIVASYRVSAAGVELGQPQRDDVLELGSGRMPVGLEEQLVGVTAGSDKEVTVELPADYPNPDLAGKQVQFSMQISAVKEKQLPELNDEFALESAGFDTLAQLREDLRAKLEDADAKQIAGEFRRAVLDAAVAEAQIDLPASIVTARAEEMLNQHFHQLAHQGIDKASYLRMVGKEEAELLPELQSDAEQSLKREAVLAAVATAAQIEPTEAELEEVVAPIAEREGAKPAKVLKQMRKKNAIKSLVRDVAAQQALDRITESAKAISPAQAEAREKLLLP